MKNLVFRTGIQSVEFCIRDPWPALFKLKNKKPTTFPKTIDFWFLNWFQYKQHHRVLPDGRVHQKWLKQQKFSDQISDHWVWPGDCTQEGELVKTCKTGKVGQQEQRPPQDTSPKKQIFLVCLGGYILHFTLKRENHVIFRADIKVLVMWEMWECALNVNREVQER